MRTETVTSARNPKFKDLLALQEKSRLRREKGLFVVEGRRELGHCLAAGYVPDTVFYCPEILPEGELGALLGGHSPLVIELPRPLYEKAAYRESTEGVLAEIKTKELSLNDLQLPENPLILVLEAVEKPGNLGAVLRSADAAGADAVLVCDPLTDLFNPNLIRASIGAIFTVPTVAVSSAQAIAWLRSRGIRIYTAQLQDSSLYYDTDLKGPSALVMGTESTGLTPQWREAADRHIRIPMRGRLDSLNVSVSASILLFEAVRQRG